MQISLQKKVENVLNKRRMQLKNEERTLVHPVHPLVR